MNGFLSAEDINKAWMRASFLIRDYAEAEAERVAAKIHLDRAEMHALAEGVEGKNAEERKAALYQRLEPLHDKLQMREEEAARVKTELDIARNEQERIRLLLRLLENVDEFGVMREG